MTDELTGKIESGISLPKSAFIGVYRRLMNSLEILRLRPKFQSPQDAST